jgi:predicted DNA-binding transcriptional regulator AlpA
MTTKKPKHKYLTPEQVAEKLGISEGTLANWRAKDMGPRWIKVSGKVMYKSEAVSTYIGNHASSMFWNDKTPVKLNWRAPGSQA